MEVFTAWRERNSRSRCTFRKWNKWVTETKSERRYLRMWPENKVSPITQLFLSWLAEGRQVLGNCNSNGEGGGRVVRLAISRRAGKRCH